MTTSCITYTIVRHAAGISRIRSRHTLEVRLGARSLVESYRSFQEFAWPCTTPSGVSVDLHV